MNQDIPRKCFIWKTHATVKPQGAHRYEVDSIRAGGKYEISAMVVPELDEIENQGRLCLTSWLVQQRLNREGNPFIQGDIIKDAKSGKLLPSMQIEERVNQLLLYLEYKLKEEKSDVLFLGYNLQDEYNISLNATYADSLAWTESISAQNLFPLLDFLERQGYISIPKKAHVCLTVEGRVGLEEIRGDKNPSQSAFVAMWFNPSMDKIYKEAIRPGIEEAGYELIRIDEKEHTNKIDDEIIAAIRQSRFLLADFTHGGEGARGGVYYEAGFAHGLNIPVIFTCRKDLIDKIHFDTRQYNTILWTEDEMEALKKAITNRIIAVIGVGPKESSQKQP